MKVLEVSSIKLTSIALSMAKESDKVGDDEVEEEVMEGTQHKSSSQHSNKSNKNAASSESPLSSSKRTSTNPLNDTQMTKTAKYTQHKWDTELSRRKLLLLYYLVRGRTFNRYSAWPSACGVSCFGFDEKSRYCSTSLFQHFFPMKIVVLLLLKYALLFE